MALGVKTNLQTSHSSSLLSVDYKFLKLILMFVKLCLHIIYLLIPEIGQPLKYIDSVTVSKKCHKPACKTQYNKALVK